ncbi:MAG: MarR family transcriptional regulator [Acidobacteria bacterium]|nr:MAG: MarR family transcriptional regulator [Acidobacteriota bacterium]
MGANTSTATRDVLDAVRRIVQTLHESSRSAEHHLGVSGAQLFVLQRLAERPAASLNELAARTHTHQSSVSVVVARLAERGLVRRAAAKDDGRKREITLTAAGHLLAARAPHAAQDRLIAAIQQLSPARRAELADVLTDLATKVSGTRRAGMFFESPK